MYLSGLGNISDDTLALLKTNMASQIAGGLDVRKAITQATGLVWFDLQAPAKVLYPVITPIRNRIPRVKGNGGTATNWRQINSISGSGMPYMGWVPEGQRTAQMTQNVTTVAASYVTLGEENGISFEAINASENFEDEFALMQVRLLQQMFIKEEIALLFGNASLQLGTVGTITASASGSGATLPAATYYIKCVALTAEAMQAAAVTSVGCVPTYAITGSDGKTYTLNGGTSQISAEASQAVTLGQTLFASVATINGAAGYAWYISTATGTETVQAITTINSVAINAPLTAGTQSQTGLFAADYSANPNYAFNGLLTSAYSSGTAIITIQPTGTAGTGTPLTASGRGSVVEIDTLLQNMWNSFRLSPTLMLVNSQELKNITNKVLSNATGPLLRYELSANGQNYSLGAGGTIEYYYNPFAAGPGIKIPIFLHPNVPAGTILLYTENLPAQYVSNNVPNVAEVKTRQDYYNIVWPLVTRQRQVGVYAEEVLAVYAPFAMGAIRNIGNG
ncbi:MAG: hypothetical protein ACREJM_14355 [Candidatus Saccharimonadales bacterium]